MIITKAEVRIKNGAEAAFLKIAQELVNETRKEAGCIYYTLLKNPFAADQFTVVERWESKAALDAHMETKHFKAFVAGAGDLLVGGIQIESYQAEKIS